MSLGLVYSLRMNERAMRDSIVSEAIANNKVSLDVRRELGSKFLVDIAVDEDAVGRHARLSRRAKLAEDGSRNSSINVGILKDNEGSISAQLQRYLFEGCFRALSHQDLSHVG